MKTKTTLEKAVKFVNNCKFIFSFKKNIFQKNIFPVLFGLITTISFAQTKNIDSYLTNLKASGTESELAHVKHLVYDVQSAVYYLSPDKNIKTYGNHPTALFTDVDSLNTLDSHLVPSSDIEIATVKIKTNSDLNKQIDLDVFSGFGKLKYIYIKSNIQASEAVLNNMIKNDTSKYVLIYNISIGG